jgi:hypothetical protein
VYLSPSGEEKKPRFSATAPPLEPTAAQHSQNLKAKSYMEYISDETI